MKELVYSTFATQTNEIIRVCPVPSSQTFTKDEAKKVIVFPKKYFSMYNEKEIEVPSNGDDFLLTVSVPAKRSLRARKEQINLDIAETRKYFS